MRRSKIWDIPDSALRALYELHENVQGVAEALEVKDGGNAYRILLNRIKSLNLNFKTKRKRDKFLIPLKNLLTTKSLATRATVRSRIVRDKILPYQCANCKNQGEHLGLPLSLHLDHINGVKDDHRLENLRFLCPNCHSQTSTYAGRNAKKSLTLTAP
ncbi:MAG: HNH endonuclease signature motif containing protein [Betaproteobacteria bacterium]